MVKICVSVLFTLLLGCSALPSPKGHQRRSVEGTVSYSGYKLFRTEVPLTQLPVVDSLDSSEGVDVWSWRYNDHNDYELDVLTPPEAEEQVKQVFTEYQLTYQKVIDDLQNAIDLELSEEDDIFRPRPAHPMTWEQYHSGEDMDMFLDYLSSSYPDLVTLIDIGKSFENRTLRVAKVSTGGNKPGVFIEGGIHSREWISPATAMYILRSLVEYNWEDSEIINQFDWYILPLANPDGYEYTRQHDRLWRKTRSVDPAFPGCVGVDANRNFGFKWMEGGASPYPCSDIYAGPSAFSEPETRAIRDFLHEYGDQLKVYLAIHAYSQMWMLPWGYTSERPKNYDKMHEVALKATEALKVSYGTKYRIGSIPELLYVATGNSGDYGLGVVGIPYSYSLELRDLGRYGFILPKEQILPTAVETYDAIKAMAQAVQEQLQASNSTETINY